MNVKNLLIFASGSGSNAENIIHHFRGQNNFNKDGNCEIHIVGILTNNPNAGVIERAKRLDIPCVVFTKSTWMDEMAMLALVRQFKPDFIVLAGFLWKFPAFLISEIQGHVINLHPALLPKFGGKGMYGMHVHEAVVANHETETGITIHWVNEHYDEGNIIAQFKCDVAATDTAEIVAEKIHALEGRYFPSVVDSTISSY